MSEQQTQLPTQAQVLPLSGEIALVTGASRGIGQAIALALGQAGAVVAGTATTEVGAERISDYLTARGVQGAGLVLDVADPQSVESLMERLTTDLGAPSILVNNAGITRDSLLMRMKDGDWQSIIDTNLGSVYRMSKACLRPMTKARKGRIINIASVAANYPYAGGNVYGGTKAFVRQLTLGLRSDLHGTGVRVTSIEPGMVETEFTLVRTGGNADAHQKLYGGADPMTAGDIAETVRWVAELPPHLNINTLELMPVSQSFAGFQVARDN